MGAFDRPKKPSGRHAAGLRRDGITARVSYRFNFLATRVLGYDFNRMVVEFTMLNEDKIIQCAISTEALDHLERGFNGKTEDRVNQFERLRSAIEERADQKFSAGFVEAGGRLVLRSGDFRQ
jgi:hypothetical protein